MRTTQPRRRGRLHAANSTLLAVLLSLAALPCHSEPSKIEERDVRGFNAVSLETEGRLIIVQGSAESLTIEASPKMLRRITANVVGGTLRIGYRGIFGGKDSMPTFKLGMKAIRELISSSSGSIEAERVEADDLYIEASSSGDIAIETLKAGATKIRIRSSGNVRIADCKLAGLDAEIGSSGDLIIAGETNSAAFRSSSSGGMLGDKLKTSSASIRLGSSGDAAVWVTDRLEANLSGKGCLEYSGEPALGNIVASGSGRIRRLDRR